MPSDAPEFSETFARNLCDTCLAVSGAELFEKTGAIKDLQYFVLLISSQFPSVRTFYNLFTRP